MDATNTTISIGVIIQIAALISFWIGKLIDWKKKPARKKPKPKDDKEIPSVRYGSLALTLLVHGFFLLMNSFWLWRLISSPEPVTRADVASISMLNILFAFLLVSFIVSIAIEILSLSLESQTKNIHAEVKKLLKERLEHRPSR